MKNLFVVKHFSKVFSHTADMPESFFSGNSFVSIREKKRIVAVNFQAESNNFDNKLPKAKKKSGI